MQTEWFKGDYQVSTDRTKLNLHLIHSYLTNSYWAKGIPLEVVEKSIEGSLPFAVFREAEQVGFARVITDYATFMYLADVFIVEAYKGQGLGVWLIDTIVNYEAFKGLRTWTLLTSDAHGLYEKFGFEVPEDTRKFMRRKVPYPYSN